MLRALSTLAACSLLTSMASAFTEVADGELTFDGSATTTWDSNIIGRNGGPSDTVYILTPGLEYSHTHSRIELEAGVTAAINRYQKYDTQNSTNYSAHLDMRLPTAKSARIQGRAFAHYTNGKRIDIYQNTRVQTETLDVGMEGTYAVSTVINYRLNLDHSLTKLDGPGDTSTTAISTGLGYNINAGTSAFADINYRRLIGDNSLLFASNPSSKNYGITTGLTGQLSPKVSGTVSAGLERVHYDTQTTQISDATSPTLSVSLSWTPRPKTSVSLNATKLKSVTTTARSADSTLASFLVSQKIGDQIDATLSAGLGRYNYEGTPPRADNTRNFSIGAVYHASEHLSFGTEYNYTSSSSDDAIADYTRSTFSLTGSFNY